MTDRSEGFGERLLGTMIDRAHQMPPELIAPLVGEVLAVIGCRDVAVLPGRGLVAGEPEPIAGSFAGRAFLGDDIVEQTVDAGVRLFVPLLDGTDRLGVLAFTVDDPDTDDRRLARRFAGLVADVLVTKGGYTDRLPSDRQPTARRWRPGRGAAVTVTWVPPVAILDWVAAGSFAPRACLGITCCRLDRKEGL